MELSCLNAWHLAVFAQSIELSFLQQAEAIQRFDKGQSAANNWGVLYPRFHGSDTPVRKCNAPQVQEIQEHPR